MIRISNHPARIIAARIIAARIITALAMLWAVGPMAGCRSSARAPDIIPALPGDGDTHTAKPGEPTATQPETLDPWAGRDDLIALPAPMKARAIELPPIERFTLKNGLQVIFVPSAALPVVHMNLAIKAGRADAPHDKMGLADLVAAMLTRGTRTRNAQKLAGSIDQVAGSLTTDASMDATLLTCAVLKKHLRTCSTLLSDLVMNPTFPAADMEEMAKKLQVAVRQRHNDLGQLANAHLYNLLFGNDHARGRPMSERTIAAIERKDVQTFHRTWFVPNNAVLTVAGDIDAKALRIELEKAFRWWRRGKVPAHATHADPALGGVKIRLIDAPGPAHAQIRIGQLAIPHADPLFFDFLVVNHVLGGGVNPGLARVLRAQLGKPYSASATFDRNRERGAWVISTATQNSDVRPAIELLVGEIARVKDKGVGPEDLRAAQTHLLGASAVRFGSVADVGNALLAAELHALGSAYVRDYQLSVAGVTPESASKAAARILDPQKLAVVIAGDARQIAPQLDKAGWAYETIRSISPVASVERDSNVPRGPVDAKSEAAARAILDQALKATGGAARLGRIKSVTMQAKGKIAIQNRELPATFKRRFQAPDKLRMDIELDLGGGTADVVTLINGNQAWNKQPGQGVVALPAEAVTELRKQIWRAQEFILLRHREKGTRVESLGDGMFDGRAVDKVNVTSAGGDISVILYLDKKTHLLAGMTYAEQGVQAEETYGDYKLVDGIQVAHRRKTTSQDAVLAIEVSAVVFNQPMAASVFSEPR